MPELRTDWLSGRTVFIAENRAERPNEFCEPAFGGPGSGEPRLLCPFCPGQEHVTPPAVYEVRNEAGEWQIRVVPNKYPAVTMPIVGAYLSASVRDQHLPAAEAASPQGEAVPAVGAHEVIIESPRHIQRLSALTVRELHDVLHTYAQRLLHWRNDGRFAYGLVFKNQGSRAGASLAHLHSQFIALPSVPPPVHAELCRAEHEWRVDRVCPYCRRIERERSFGKRVVDNSNGFIAFCPFASLQPFEVWLLPTEHMPSFEQMPADNLHALADVVHKLIVRVEAVVPGAAYNLLVRTAPWCGNPGDWSHWRIELLPRVTPLAGLELASGMFINPLAPERAASKLRSV